MQRLAHSDFQYPHEVPLLRVIHVCALGMGCYWQL